jgi:thermitase
MIASRRLIFSRSLLNALSGIVVLTLLLSAQPAWGQPAGQSASPFVEDEILVRFKPGLGANGGGPALAAFDAVAQPSPELAKIGVQLVRVPRGKVLETVDSLQQASQVEFSEPNYLVQAAGPLTPTIPNDPLYLAYQWGPPIVQAPLAWSVTTGTASVVIAVIDTGVDLSHPELAPNIWTNAGETGLDANGQDKRTNGVDDDHDGYVDDWHGWNFVAGTNNPQDDQGHGTHVSGIADAVGNNGVGVAGMAWQARIMALKILDSTGNGSISNLATAMIYATDHGARIINLSLGDTAPSTVMEDAVNYAYAHGVTVVAAAGNNGTQVLYPAAYPNAIAVASVDWNNHRSYFSNIGPQVALAAPGGFDGGGFGIYSTCLGGGYCYKSGTSMATPYVAGAAALLASLPVFNTPDRIRNALQNTALDLGPAGRDSQYGYRLGQAYAALNYRYRVSLAPAADHKFNLLFSRVVAYTLAITNTGLITDSFNVAVSPGSVFSNTVEPAIISDLVPQAGALVTLTVTLPPAAVPGTRETATVTVISSGDPTTQATATFSTTASYQLRLLLLLR